MSNVLGFSGTTAFRISRVTFLPIQSPHVGPPQTRSSRGKKKKMGRSTNNAAHLQPRFLVFFLYVCVRVFQFSSVLSFWDSVERTKDGGRGGSLNGLLSLTMPRVADDVVSAGPSATICSTPHTHSCWCLVLQGYTCFVAGNVKWSPLVHLN